MPLILIRFGLWWKRTAWPWLKKNWYWVLLAPIGLGILVFKFFQPTKVEVVSTELSEADEVRREAEGTKQEGLSNAGKVLDDELAEAVRVHDAALGTLVDKQKQEADTPPEGQNLTDLLTAVGKDVRK